MGLPILLSSEFSDTLLFFPTCPIALGFPFELHQEVVQVSCGFYRRLEVSWLPGGEQCGANRV